ncbi:peptidoglycan amidohydrolase family protein [uncultured Anaerococcus sp.]|uniref:peptidoglycan amidohydrolase family protein n=1 Tax=uncultured Anaerococcus sp. TaxID=293428 RepID=UPI00288A9FEF|nr:peptidoglycan amidohydrolase family protein [uncultured Anaerococcus sp.]
MTQEKMIDFALSKIGRAAYSMAYPARLGPNFYDCSSFVYYALIAGGYLAKGTAIGNTESLYRLNGTVLKEIYSYKEVRRGDIFIRGIEGKSAGAAGHTGIFLEKDKIIHCSYRANGVTITDMERGLAYILDRQRSNRERYFRPQAANKNLSQMIIDKVGMVVIRVATNVRTAPNLSAPIVACYYPGQIVYYDKLVETPTHLWASYIGSQSGQRRYLAIREKGV